MRPAAVLLSFLLAACLAAPTLATGVESTLVTTGGLTTYNYVLTSDETYDLITSFHVYAPTSRSVILSSGAASGWVGAIDPDPEGGVDIYWYVDGSTNAGLGLGESAQFSLTTSASLPPANDYVIPGFLGNWGYETLAWAEYGVLVMPTSIPVPSGQAEAPEPLGLLALGAGCVALAPWRKRK